ncbi:putative pentatricopeptide repeat-containing protein, mitochondrial [Capsicum annuum]|uniref:Pentatricopeptide repeat-containing protein, mitochondrial n=1 Tax=Capsicum annuum TaxID=4072 RepID=A0A1U8FZL2_CAPAN|nr:putative pentatricopeptide repeat-containing protein At5g06400, mitochondrial [Capsicum annuum]KAF3643030.1 putative pentatricopeptide repeat-containing protein, mitochondrial [Capsicum annuum]KAF3670761.1 putative pentatricopeptide repeat-containing protein, mitochondrial [Capsicum annuum]PHT95466.1 putative pentatricopeptide repeat-containing protein, mitochondrial [Capsicum annuum]
MLFQRRMILKCFCKQRFKILSCSISTKSSTRLQKSKKTENPNLKNKNNQQPQIFTSLFNEIREILGTENVHFVDSSSCTETVCENVKQSTKLEYSSSCIELVCENANKSTEMEGSSSCIEPVCENAKKSAVMGGSLSCIEPVCENANKNAEMEGSSSCIEPVRENANKSTEMEGSLSCIEPVCENANENAEMEGSLSCIENVRENAKLSALREDTRDVSPIVHKITRILKSECDAIAMEERLESGGFEYNEEVVDKVLKRCFKVPHLALRFFDWVKSREGFSHTTATYNTMIYMAADAKESRLVEELVEEMEKSSCRKILKTWSILLSHYGNGKKIGKVLSMFEQLKKLGYEPDTRAYTIVLSSLCSAGKADIALEYFNEMIHKGLVLDAATTGQLLKCLANSGNVAAVHKVGDDVIRVSSIPEKHVYGLMLKSFCIAGRITEALELIRDLKSKNVSLDSEIFTTLVKGLCKAERINDALEIVEILKKRNGADENVYAVLISAYLRRNEISKALNLFRSMKDSGSLPNVSTYTNLMQQLFRVKEFQEAMNIYNEMTEMGVKLDTVAATAVVAGYISQNRISEMWEVFENMKDKGIVFRRKSYTIFVNELSKVSRTNDIFRFLSEMKASKMVIGNDIFQYVISYLERKGDTKNIDRIKLLQGGREVHNQENETPDVSCQQERMLELKSENVERVSSAHDMPEAGSKASVECDVHEVCQILSSSTDWCLIQQQLENCNIQFTPEIVVEVLRNFRLQGRVALQFFSWVEKRSTYIHTAESYNTAIKIAGQGKDFTQMRNLFSDMRRNGCLVDAHTWTIMIMQYGKTGLTDIAMRTFKEMKASGCKPTESTYKALIVSLCQKKGRRIDEAIKIFQEMIQVGHSPDKELIEDYLGGLCELGKFNDARSCTESLQKLGFSTPLTYSLYARSLCRAGRLEEALALMNEVDDDEQHLLKQYVYGSLVHGLLRQGQLEEALSRIESMKQVDIHPTVHVYTSLIGYYFKVKQVEKALEVFDQMQHSGCQPTIVTYSALLRGYMNMEKVSEARDVFHQMRMNGPYPDFKAYSIFISCLCKIGNSEEALQLISEMLDVGIVPSTVNYRTVFYGLNREGKQDLAKTVLHMKLEVKRRRKFLT